MKSLVTKSKVKTSPPPPPKRFPVRCVRCACCAFVPCKFLRFRATNQKNKTWTYRIPWPCPHSALNIFDAYYCEACNSFYLILFASHQRSVWPIHRMLCESSGLMREVPESVSVNRAVLKHNSFVSNKRDVLTWTAVPEWILWRSCELHSQLLNYWHPRYKGG